MIRFALTAGVLLALLNQSAAADVTLYAAGSLKGALSEVADAYARQSGVAVKREFGPSGLLRGRIEKGDVVDVFASADMAHPQKLVAEGKAAYVIRFTGNRLCAMARPELGLSSVNFLEKALSPAVKLGTSTPGSDPSGDYTWKVFDKADDIQPGAAAALKNKALQLVGGPASEVIPAGHTAVPYMFSTGKADMFIAYCTTGKAAKAEGVALSVVDLPPRLAQSADYGMVVLSRDRAAADLALFMLSEQAQSILAKWGFEAAGQR